MRTTDVASLPGERNTISINMVQMHQTNAKKGRKRCSLAFRKGSGCLQCGCYFDVLQWLWHGHAGMGRRGGIPNAAHSPSYSMGGG